MGPVVVGALRAHVGDEIDLDVHLMIERPERHVAEFAKAGATGITFHAEATPHVNYTLNQVREAGCRAGLALNPGTPPAFVAEVTADLVLCMTVNPGWGGQPFIESSPDKISRMAALAGEDTIVEVDGGVDTKTVGVCARAGASWFVAGSAVFGSDDPGAAYSAIAAAAANP
jgi:ribulose-phosphate 3-epimerase